MTSIIQNNTKIKSSIKNFLNFQVPYLLELDQVFLEEIVVSIVRPFRILATKDLQAGGEILLGEVHNELHHLLALRVDADLIINCKDLRHMF